MILKRLFLLRKKEPRWIGLDLAHSAKGDVIGICMLHKEWSMDLKPVPDSIYVVDFCFTIGPGEHGINLESVLDELKGIGVEIPDRFKPYIPHYN